MLSLIVLLFKHFGVGDEKPLVETLSASEEDLYKAKSFSLDFNSVPSSSYVEFKFCNFAAFVSGA